MWVLRGVDEDLRWRLCPSSYMGKGAIARVAAGGGRGSRTVQGGVGPSRLGRPGGRIGGPDGAGQAGLFAA